MSYDTAYLRKRAEEYRARATIASFPLCDEYRLVADVFDDVANQLDLWDARYGPPASGERHLDS